jgi:hypothetical protein
LGGKDAAAAVSAREDTAHEPFKMNIRRQLIRERRAMS